MQKEHKKLVTSLRKAMKSSVLGIALTALSVGIPLENAEAAGWVTYAAGSISSSEVGYYRSKLNLNQYGTLTSNDIINYDHAERICEAKFPGWDTWAKPQVKTNSWDWWHDVKYRGQNNWKCWDSYWSWK